MGKPYCSVCCREIDNGWFGKDKYYHQKCKDEVINNLNIYLYDDVTKLIVAKLIDIPLPPPEPKKSKLVMMSMSMK